MRRVCWRRGLMLLLCLGLWAPLLLVACGSGEAARPVETTAAKGAAETTETSAAGETGETTAAEAQTTSEAEATAAATTAPATTTAGQADLPNDPAASDQAGPPRTQEEMDQRLAADYSYYPEGPAPYTEDNPFFIKDEQGQDIAYFPNLNVIKDPLAVAPEEALRAAWKKFLAEKTPRAYWLANLNIYEQYITAETVYSYDYEPGWGGYKRSLLTLNLHDGRVQTLGALAERIGLGPTALGQQVKDVFLALLTYAEGQQHGAPLKKSVDIESLYGYEYHPYLEETNVEPFVDGLFVIAPWPLYDAAFGTFSADEEPYAVRKDFRRTALLNAPMGALAALYRDEVGVNGEPHKVVDAVNVDDHGYWYYLEVLNHDLPLDVTIERRNMDGVEKRFGPYRLQRGEALKLRLDRPEAMPGAMIVMETVTDDLNRKAVIHHPVGYDGRFGDLRLEYLAP